MKKKDWVSTRKSFAAFVKRYKVEVVAKAGFDDFEYLVRFLKPILMIRRMQYWKFSRGKLHDVYRNF